jgi:hypothetical protein
MDTASHWLKNWKSLKIFFRTTEWIETRFSQNAGTAHPPRADKSSLKSDHCFYPVWYTNYNRLSCKVQFDPVVLEKIKMWKFNGWQTTDTKWWEKLIWTFGPSELKTFMRTIKWTSLNGYTILNQSFFQWMPFPLVLMLGLSISRSICNLLPICHCLPFNDCSSSYRILLQIIQYLYIQYFCHVRICIMIIGVPDFLYCCILLIM